MTIQSIVAELDKEIKRLGEARRILVGNPIKGLAPRLVTSRGKGLTAEGRKRISDAARRRWELVRKSA